MSTARRSGRLSQLSASQVDDNQMDVDNSSEEEMVETFTSPKKRQKPTKSQAANSPASRRVSIEDSASSSSNSGSLYAPLKSGAVISTVVDEWLSDYRAAKTRPNATQALVTLILESSLLKDVPSTKVVASGNEEAVRKFVENIKVNVSGDLPDFPLASRTPAATKFSRAYLRFWQDLVTAGSENAFVDDWLLPKLMIFFAAYAQSPLRPLRFASASACFSLCSALMTQLESVSFELKQREKQRRANESRSGSKVATQRLDASMEELQKRAQKYEKGILQVWSDVFVRAAWKDRDATLRTLAAKHLGAWCIKLPRLFMDSDRFRYLTWLMADGQAEVRLAAGEALQKLLETESLRHLLENYCTHLVDRIVSFTRDSNEKVAVIGVQIARSLREHFGRDYLSEEVVREISLLISIDSPALRRAAGAFALPDIIANAEEHARGEAKDDDEEDGEPKKGRKKKTTKKDAAKKDAAAAKSGAAQLKGAASARMLSLIEFIPDLTVHQELPGVVIDAIWQNEPDSFLFQFEDIGKMLAATDSTQLSDDKLILLAEIVLAVIKKIEDSTATGKAQRFSRPQLIKSYTEVFHSLLPELFSSHKAEDKLLPSLISLTKFLNTTHIGTLKADGTRNSVTQLAQNLKAILLSTTNENVMTKAVSAFDHLLADSTFKYHRDVDRVFRTMLDEMVESLRGFVDGFDAPGSSQVTRPKRRESTPGSAAFVDGAAPGSAPLVLCLTRLFSLTRYFDLNLLDDTLVDLALKVLETRVDGLVQVVGPRSAHFASQLAARLLCYRVNEFTIEKGAEDAKTMDEDDQYDVRPGDEEQADENSDDEMLDTQASRRSRRGSQKKKAATMEVSDAGDDAAATPSKRKGKKANDNKNKLYGAIFIPRVPSSAEVAAISKKVHHAIDMCHQLLSRTVDDSDLDDLASYGAMLALGHLLSTFCPSLSKTVLKDLAYECPKDLEEEMWTAFEAEMERVPQEDDEAEVERRTLVVLNFYYRLSAIGVFGRSTDVECAKRCIAQLKSPHGFVSRSARQILNELRASTFETALKYGTLVSETLKYVYELAPATDKTDRDDAQRHQEVVSLAKQLAKSFPPGNTTLGTEACKIVLDALVKHIIRRDDEEWQLLAWSCAPFVSKLSPAAARKLLEDWSGSVDHQVQNNAEAEVKETYEELKNLLKHRASGRRPAKPVQEDDDADNMDASISESITNKRTPKKTAKASASKRTSNAAEDDEEEEFTAKNRTPKQTPKKTPKKSAATETTPQRRSSRASTTTPIHQGAAAGDAASVTEDSEMAHTEDSESVQAADDTAPHTAVSARSEMVSTAKMSMDVDESAGEEEVTPSKSAATRGSRKSATKKTKSSQGSSGQVGESEDEDDQIPLSQSSVEIDMDQFLEPPATRPKRGRASVLSQSSQASATAAKDDGEDTDSDSDSIMKHTPVPKKRAGRK